MKLKRNAFHGKWREIKLKWEYNNKKNTSIKLKEKPLKQKSELCHARAIVTYFKILPDLLVSLFLEHYSE